MQTRDKVKSLHLYNIREFSQLIIGRLYQAAVAGEKSFQIVNIL